MKQIIPFTKDINFNTKISEITSISLEHNYGVNNNIISGNFIISGDYKIHDASIEKENFNYKIPFDIDLTDRYDTSNCSFEIDDFYYEIIDNNIMRCNIEVILDSLEEKLETKEEEKIEELEIDNTEIIEELRDNIIEENLNQEIEDNVLKEEYNTEERNKEVVEVTEIESEPEKNVIQEQTVKELTQSDKEQQTKKEAIPQNNILVNTDSLKKLFDEETDEVFSTYKIYIIRDNDNIETITKKYGINKEILEEYNDLNNLKLNDKIIIPCINE